ncbi:MAG TPA: YsnF/AvaK domain-containing protein, partial [Candidatus Limnocylindrales bacterium]|nr:YsnF/AvaK domain-containing protein [Candidatus Limnocylindrales bacterium]
PRSQIGREEGDDWYLSINKDEIESMNWSQAPADSAWSQEWREGRLDAETGRGQTRLRRYEEDVEVDKVEREAGEVVVSKHVVEETKSFEVPVRREEVHVERRPVTDQQSAGTGSAEGAFSDETIRVQVMEEDVELRKVARPVEEIEITKTATEDKRQVDTTVRREEFDVDDSTNR